MNAIVVDDEHRARLLLSAMLSEHCPQVQVVSACEDLAQAIKAIRREQPSLVFLDIEMPGHSGLELLDFFTDDEINFDIIFTTAYSEYAIRAFKMSAIDYLLKPIQPDELVQAVERVEKKQSQLASLQLLKENLAGKSKKIVLNQAKGIEFLDTADVLFMKGDGAYTEIFKQDGSKVVASKNLKQFEEMLNDQPQFLRVQKSYIINTNFVTSISKADGNLQAVIDNHLVPVSIEKVNVLLEKLQ
jgi:two-component system LytT family response regulator